MTPVQALQATLAGEHAAVYVYGVLGGQASDSHDPRLLEALSRAYRTHRARRDRLMEMVSRHDVEPVPGEPAYQLPNASTTPAQLRAGALVVEQRLARLYGQLVGSTSGAERAWGVGALAACAVTQLAFGGEPSDFPGL